MFGVGVDAGQTTIPPAPRVRRARQRSAPARSRARSWTSTCSRTSLEYWGPNGMLFFRNVQVCWQPMITATRSFTLASSGRARAATPASTPIASSCRTSSRAFRCPTSPATTVRRRAGATCELAGIVRDIDWDDVLDDTFDLSAAAPPAGASASARTSSSRKHDVLRAAGVYGEGIQNYFNDAPVDVGVENNLAQPAYAAQRQGAARSSASSPTSTTLERRSARARSASRWSDIDNTDAQAPDAFHNGQYASANLLYHAGAERHDGRRVPVGPAREQRRRLHVRRLPAAVLVQVQLLEDTSEASNAMNRHRLARGLVAALDARCASRPRRRPSRRRTPADIQNARQRRLREVQGPEGGQERRLHPGARQGRPELFGIALVTPTARSTRPATSRPRSRSSRSRRCSRWRG